MLAVALVFGACKKNPSNPQSEGGSGEKAPAPEGLRFVDPEGDSLAYVEGQTYPEEELIIPSVSPDDKIVTKIGDLGFYGNTNLKKVVLPEGITVIGGMAFASCTSLTSVELPYSLEQIKAEAFDGCTALTEITYRGTISAWEGILIRSDWIDIGKTITIHCSDGDTTATGAKVQSK